MAQPTAINQTLARLAYLDTHNQVPTLARVAVAVAAALTVWSFRRKTRKTLEALDPHLLRDIGVTPEHAMQEAQKPFWEG